MSIESILATRQSLLHALRDPKDEAAWTRFLEQYRPSIARWCRAKNLQAADVDDLTQQVLLVLVRELRGFAYDPAKKFRGWLKTVVNNTVINFWRCRTRHPGDHGTGGSDAQDAIAQLPDESLGEQIGEQIGELLEWSADIILRVQQKVKPHVWQAFYLSVCKGMAGKDVADQLGIPYQNVYVYKQRVLEKLKEEGDRTGLPPKKP